MPAIFKKVKSTLFHDQKKRNNLVIKLKLITKRLTTAIGPKR